MVDPLLLTTVRIVTLSTARTLTNATGFFYRRDERLFLVTSRHVVVDEASDHHPDQLRIELHTDADSLAQTVGFTIPLYRAGKSIWRQGRDAAGAIDVAVIEIDRSAVDDGIVYAAFTPSHLYRPATKIEIGAPLLVVGYPLGFHDTLYHMPVVRQAIVASPFGLRFQGEGFFLTDARTHRGSSGAPVVMRLAEPSAAQAELPWMLLGIHSARFDSLTRDTEVDEALGLNCAWYADMLNTLTKK